MYKATLVNGQTFEINSGEKILDAAQRNGININYSCRNGRCSSCKCRIIEGNTQSLTAETGLQTKELEEGWILSCVRSALNDLVLDVEDIFDRELPPIKTLPCKIHNIKRATENVLVVSLRFPPSTEFSFIPGQYVDIIGPNNIRRSYSIANADFAEKLLELHIGLVEDGIMSNYWFNHAQVNDLLYLNGPLGTFFIREPQQLNLYFLATGTGIAPIKAMLESMNDLPVENKPSSITVLWGGRRPEDLYIDFNSKSGDHRFIPVCSRSDNTWAGAKGYVQDVLLELNPDLSNSVVYACGSDAMIQNAWELLAAHGLSSKYFYSDVFVSSGNRL